MKKLLFISFILYLVVPASFSQTIKELEYELSSYKPGEKDEDKINLARELLSLDSLNRKTIRFICRYYYDKKIDSVSVFFDKLIKNHPNNPEPYIIRADLIYFESKHHNEHNKARYLNKALQLDSLNVEACYNLATLYYKDFIAPTEKITRGFGLKEDSDSNYERNRKSVFSYSADSALYYFYHLIRINPSMEEIVFVPIQQLEKYKNINLSVKPLPTSGLNVNCYFPYWYFANLSEGWENDMTKDYMFIMDFSYGTAMGLKIFLEEMKEPCLYQNILPPETEVFRFTWLRSFDPPIVVRVEKKGNEVILYWKEAKENEVDESLELTVDKSRKLNLEDWNRFKDIFKSTEFEKKPNYSYYPMTDGATWTLEHKTTDSFKAHNTNIPSGKFKDSCLFLISLTDLKIEEKYIY